MPSSAPRATKSEIRTVSFVSLGCPKNLVDSEKMLGLLAEDGLTVVSYDACAFSEEPGVDAGTGQIIKSAPTKGADAVVINTCGFLEASKEESLQVIQDAIRAKEKGKLKRVIVAGCLVQRHRAKMLEWAPGIDAMVGVFDRDHIVEAVRGGAATAKREDIGKDAGATPKYWIAGNALVAAKERGMKTTGLTVHGKDGQGVGYFEDDSARLRITPRHYAYLRMSEGCNQNCAFCTIPSIRGKMRSKPLEAIAREAKELVADGVFEINLIGQDTTSYGDDIGVGMAGAKSGKGFTRGMPAVLKTVSDAFNAAGVDGWVRLMYAYPSNFSDEMIDALAALTHPSCGGKGKSGGKVLPYIDIPLQHASDHMLRAMKRNVSAAHQRELMLKLRERVPGMAIRTTFISGFPGETEDDHKKLLEFVEEIGFDALGVFEYSHEEGTVAGTMEDDPKLAVPAEVKARRRGEVMALQQRIAFEQNAFVAEQFDEKNPANTGVRFDILIDSATRTSGKKTSGVTEGGGLYTGRTYFQAPQIDAVTFVHSKKNLSPGELVRCTTVGSDGYDFIARPCEELEKKVGLKILR
ncbi:MAG: 30S ribosomal protein S12 methylthiotransferase RimO [Phycisphaerales bacterium]|nr:30S ribosomal protein S12 methylthiotransferase RimO [Phycisphaerales bacterium]